ncbi:hypothetical protein BZARG_363 [Bizionia argentinensis JUB59]|uniref:Uncharacterized protein n=1 Tax=Bizionia argentinensis JUB59 TaxID=1046627 RepID=G2EA02_9FLAO|nr:hypothetical protein [Bizionia argentinensis]EGV44820.1 hypothetical protein BZARG_363 [Bizionia argentinensis JUB59]
MAKFLAVDANGLNTFISNGDIMLVNPFCKKHTNSKNTDDTASFSQLDHASVQLLTLSINCTTSFQFDLFSWETRDAEFITVFDDHFTSSLSYRYLDNVSPPPRTA